MRRTPRFFPSRLEPEARGVYGAVTAFFVLLFLALIWPVYPTFGTIRPLILGIPLSLFYVVVLLVAGFLALLVLFLWEDARGGTRTRRSGGPPASGRRRPSGPEGDRRRGGTRSG